jgi:hypothetical protein
MADAYQFGFERWFELTLLEEVPVDGCKEELILDIPFDVPRGSQPTETIFLQ